MRWFSLSFSDSLGLLFNAWKKSLPARGHNRTPVKVDFNTFLIKFQTLSCYFFSNICPVHTRPEGFEIGVFTLKTTQMFSVRTSRRKFENAIITGQLGFCF